MKFAEMQKQHETLLALQEKGQINVEMVERFIENVRSSAKEYSTEERELAWAILRYWASFIFELKGDYPVTELSPAIISSTISWERYRRMSFFIFVVILFFWGAGYLISNIKNLESISLPQIIVLAQQEITLFLGIIIIILLVIIIVLWQRIRNFVVGVRQRVTGLGRRVTEVVQNVRKTIVGGARGKPLARLRVIEGPQNMINQDLGLYTESVKLGRDPQKVDMSFYRTDMNSSVSGLHARLERVNQTWRIVAVSASRSEVFINDDPIPFNEPISLNSGQIIRLGYPAQRPVVFEFIDLSRDFSSLKKKEVSPRSTDVRDITLPIQPKHQNEKPQTDGQEDDIFNEYRNR